MELKLASIEGAKVLAPAGRIDHATVDGFQAALEPHLTACREGAPPVILDMSGVEYISSVGLRVLMVAAKKVKAQAGRIAVAALTPMVREIFEISRFNLVLDVYETVSAAANRKS
jgi:anti-anti-sigma factor